MKKIFSLVFVAFSVILLSAFASAADLSASWSVSNMYQNQVQAVTVNISNSGPNALNVNASLDLSEFATGSWSTTYTNLTANSSFVRMFNLTSDDDTDIGTHTLTMSLNGVGTTNSSYTDSSTSSKTLSVLYPYCENVSNMTRNPLRIVEIKNEGDLRDEDFRPLDELEVKVKVENTNDDDSEYAILEIVLVQGSSDVEDTDSKKKVKIQEGDYYTFTENMTIPADMEEGKAYLYIRLYNDNDDNNCDQEEIEINIEKNSKELQPYALDFPTSVSCGSTYTLSGKIVNIGDSDEEKVRVTLNALSQTFYEEYNDLDSGDYSSLFSFDVKAPTNLTEGSGKINLRVDYDYDDDDESYDDYESFNYAMTIANCKKDAATFSTETSTALTSTESEVRFLITNPSSYSQTYTVSATADWATVSSVTPQTVTLEAGKQQYVSVKLTPNKDATIGTHNVAAKVSYGSTTETLNLPVSVQKSSTSMGVFDQVAYQFKYNTMWAVIDVVMVVAIIVLLVLIFVGKK